MGDPLLGKVSCLFVKEQAFIIPPLLRINYIKTSHQQMVHFINGKVPKSQHLEKKIHTQADWIQINKLMPINQQAFTGSSILLKNRLPPCRNPYFLYHPRLWIYMRRGQVELHKSAYDHLYCYKQIELFERSPKRFALFSAGFKLWKFKCLSIRYEVNKLLCEKCKEGKGFQNACTYT